jgi:cytochrome c-type biogenesis protein CcmH/NrfG
MMEATKQGGSGGDRERLTLSELSVLADRAEAQGDVERAISYLETVAGRLDPKDQNVFKIRNRIKDLRDKSLGYAK